MTGSSPEPRYSTVVGAEVFGSFVLTAVVVGTAVMGATAVGPLGVAAASGLALLAVVATIGRISGGHVNPAVTIGLALAGRFPWRDVSSYVVAQLVGTVLGAGIVLAVVAGGPGAALADAQRVGFASGGYGLEGSPGGYGLLSVALLEVLCAAVLVGVYAVVGPRDGRARGEGVAGGAAAIGAALAGLSLLALPVSNAPVNPARALATALFAGPDRLAQVWAFVLFPLVGALVAGLALRFGSRAAAPADADAVRDDA